MSQRQNSLFDAEPTEWELDDCAEQLVATLVLPEGAQGEFDYLVPDRLAQEVEVGRRLQAPLGRGNRPVQGFCVRVENRRIGTRKLKSIDKVIDRHSLLSPAMLRLTQWMADYYLCSWGQVLQAVIPAGVRAGAGTRSATVLSVAPNWQTLPQAQKLPARQAEILKILASSAAPMLAPELAERAGCTSGPITALRKKGLIVAATQRVSHYQHSESIVERESKLEFNADQQVAYQKILATIRASRHETILIHGVTGSGKTEVYMQAIQEVVSYGRQAIVLVPEISLTPQTRDRFRRRFDRVAVLHSHMTDSERAWHWQQIAAGEVQVVVGARSAIFAPTPHLGLVVVDEEHESSFKQGEVPRYHAREVAIRRTAAEDVPLVLGSATPSLETWQRAKDGQYELIELPRRVLDRPLPEVVTVDLRNTQQDRLNSGAISRQLHQAMDSALREGGQVILLLNRRGFSTHIQCPACGLVLQCPQCEISLTHHRQGETAVCHYCDYEIPAPADCPECKSPGIRYGGRGTQKLEMEVRARFREYTCLRMDTDSMQKPGSHEQALAAFERGEVQILLGTQMIAKGLDFPNVRLVGVINADTALHLPDFRAAERTFHLVTQVAGRTGRGEQGGRVLVQTFDPEHPAIQAAARHDYARFAASELPSRRAHGYPPFTSMARIVVRGPAQHVAREFADHIAGLVRAAAKQLEAEIRVLGPSCAPIAKLRNLYRFQIQLTAVDGDRLRAAIRAATADLKPPADIQWLADIDPLDMM